MSRFQHSKSDGAPADSCRRGRRPTQVTWHFWTIISKDLVQKEGAIRVGDEGSVAKRCGLVALAGNHSRDEAC